VYLHVESGVGVNKPFLSLAQAPVCVAAARAVACRRFIYTSSCIHRIVRTRTRSLDVAVDAVLRLGRLVGRLHALEEQEAFFLV
jgi:hypothetical protein